MIVQCDNCQTKFRIADGKVTERGVKVRCSKCAHVFLVRREAPSSPEMPQYPPNGPTTGRMNPERLAQLAAGTQRGASGLRAPPSKIPNFSTMPGGSVPGGMGAAHNPPPIPSASAPDIPENFVTLQTIPPTNMGFAPVVDTRQAAEALGFSKSSMEKAAAKVELPSFPDMNTAERAAMGLPGAVPTDLSAPVEDLDQPIEVDLSLDDSDDLIAMDAPSSGSLELPPPPENLLGPGLSAPELSAPELSGAFDPQSPPGAPLEGSVELSVERFPPPQATEVSEAGAIPSPDLPPPSHDISSRDINPDSQGLLPEGATSDDPFANIDLEQPSENYDLSPPGGPSLSSAGVYQSEEPTRTPMAKIALQKAAGVPQLKPRGSSQMATVAAVPSYSSETEMPKPKERKPLKKAGAWPTVLGVALGAAAVFLLITPRGRALLGPAGAPLVQKLQAQIAPANSGLPLEVEEARVRAYPVQDKGLIVITGVVRNKGGAPLDQLRAVVRVFEGEQVQLRKESPLGLLYTEAELAAGVEDPNTRRTAVPEQVLEAGRSAPFMVVLWEPVPNAETKRFRLEFTRAATAQTKTR